MCVYTHERLNSDDDSSKHSLIMIRSKAGMGTYTGNCPLCGDRITLSFVGSSHDIVETGETKTVPADPTRTDRELIYERHTSHPQPTTGYVYIIKKI